MEHEALDLLALALGHLQHSLWLLPHSLWQAPRNCRFLSLVVVEDVLKFLQHNHGCNKRRNNVRHIPICSYTWRHLMTIFIPSFPSHETSENIIHNLSYSMSQNCATIMTDLLPAAKNHGLPEHNHNNRIKNLAHVVWNLIALHTAACYSPHCKTPHDHVTLVNNKKFASVVSVTLRGCWEEPSVDQCQSRGTFLTTSFHGHWSMRICPENKVPGNWSIWMSLEIHMD